LRARITSVEIPATLDRARVVQQFANDEISPADEARNAFLFSGLPLD